jgi:hypothetical protein
MTSSLTSLIPAKAGIQHAWLWAPAFAGASEK